MMIFTEEQVKRLPGSRVRLVDGTEGTVRSIVEICQAAGWAEVKMTNQMICHANIWHANLSEVRRADQFDIAEVLEWAGEKDEAETGITPASSEFAKLLVSRTEGPPITIGGGQIVESSEYRHLRAILDDAYDQAANGKGKDRHAAEGQAWVDQPILTEQRAHGTNHFAIGQARKKALEALRLDYRRARTDLLGAIVYLAAAIRFIDENEGA